MCLDKIVGYIASAGIEEERYGKVTTLLNVFQCMALRYRLTFCRRDRRIRVVCGRLEAFRKAGFLRKRMIRVRRATRKWEALSVMDGSCGIKSSVYLLVSSLSWPISFVLIAGVGVERNLL